MNKLYFDNFLKNESIETHHLYPDFLIFEKPIQIYKTKIENLINQPLKIITNFNNVNFS